MTLGSAVQLSKSEQQPKLSNPLRRVPASASTQMAQRARDLAAAGVDVISLSIGQPDFDTPAHVKEAALAAMNRGETGYAPIAGTVELKSAIREKLARENHLDYDADEILVANGGKQILFNALVATLDPDDEVLIPAPYWVSYPDIVRFTGATPIVLETEVNAGFKLDPARLDEAIGPNSRWLIINSPCNPTGSVYTDSELRALAQVLERHPNVWVLSDDIYEHLVYGDRGFSNIVNVAPELRHRSLLLNGVSKAYCMTGWRIGWGSAPRALIGAMTKLQSQSTSGASSISQAAAAAALRGSQDHIAEHNRHYVERRDFVLERIDQCPLIRASKPDGAFYVYVDCNEVIGRKTQAGNVLDSDEAIVAALLDEARLATVQGRAFGLSPYIRLSYATSMEQLGRAMDRLERFCATLM